MARFMAKHKLTDTKIKAASKPGMLSDGAGLYLRVHASGSKNWLYVYSIGGVRRELGLGGMSGAVPVSLAAARRKAEELRLLRVDGKDPYAERASKKATENITFGALCTAYLSERQKEWTPHTKREWERQLLEDCGKMKNVVVKAVNTDLVEATLLPIWEKKPATGQRIRSKIEAVLDFASAKKIRHGENPARWTGHLEHVMASASRTTGAQHAALDYHELPDIFPALGDAVVDRCIAFTILTAVRSGVSRQAEWSEIDWASRNWTIPAEKTKTKKELVVPLSDQAMALLRSQEGGSPSRYIFPSVNPVKSLGNSAMRKRLPEIKKGVTVHGFRSSFSDWAGEETNYAREIVEWSLAHKVGSAVEQAYRRKDALEKRRLLMSEWGVFCASASAAAREVEELLSAA
jgi:integrase